MMTDMLAIAHCRSCTEKINMFETIRMSETVCSLICQMCLGQLKSCLFSFWCAPSFRNPANFLSIQTGCTGCNCETEASMFSQPIEWGSERTQSTTRKVTGETSVVHSFYIWHQNKPAQKQTQICTTSSGIIFLLSETTPAVDGWMNRLSRRWGIDVWLWVSVLQSQLLSVFTKTQGENNQQ